MDDDYLSSVVLNFPRVDIEEECINGNVSTHCILEWCSESLAYKRRVSSVAEDDDQRTT